MSEAGVAVACHSFLVVGAEHRADRVVHADYFTRLEIFSGENLVRFLTRGDRVFIRLFELCDKVRSDGAD